MSETVPLHVAIQLPPAPHELASTGFLNTLATVEQQIADLKITDAASADLAAGLQVRLTDAGKRLKATRVALTQPFLQAQREIAAAAAGPKGRIDSAKAKLSTALTTYALEQQRIAREAEEKRQEQLRALEAQRANEAKAESDRLAELQKKADEAAALAAQGPKVVDMDDEPETTPDPVAPAAPTETEQKIAAIQAAPAVVAAKPTGVRLVTKLVATVVDVNLLPEVFVKKEAKMAALNAAYCSGWREGQPLPVCAGVKFEAKSETQSTGRQGF